jgi:hypothetical protein
MKTKILIMAFSILGLFLVQPFLAGAIRGEWQLLTAKMILRTNVTGTEPVYVPGEIAVRNSDSEPVQVSMEPAGDIAGITHLEEENFTLFPNETRRIAFTVEIIDPAIYYGEIRIFFNGTGEGLAGGLASEVIIVAEKAENPNDSPPQSELPTGYLVPLSIFIAIVIIIGVFKVRRK